MEERLARFEDKILPHLDAAYNLARWLTRNDADAQDVAQEACLRAFKFFPGFRGGDARSWLLQIVRNTFYTWREKNRRNDMTELVEEATQAPDNDVSSPDTRLLQEADQELLREAIEELPVEFRETLVMRELEGLSYKEIAGIISVPLGTVMSRLARARRLLRQCVRDRLGKKE